MTKYNTSEIARRNLMDGFFYTIELSKLFSTDDRYEDLQDLYNLVGHYNGEIRILGTFDNKDDALFFLEHMAN